MRSAFSLDDVIYAFENQMACRHVSSENSFLTNMHNTVDRDAYAIGAAHIFTYPAEQRANDSVFQQAHMDRIIATFQGGPSDLVAIKNGGDELVAQYKDEIKRMVAQSVDYDDGHSDATDCHFMVYRNMPEHFPQVICIVILLEKSEGERLIQTKCAVLYLWTMMKSKSYKEIKLPL